MGIEDMIDIVDTEIQQGAGGEDLSALVELVSDTTRKQSFLDAIAKHESTVAADKQGVDPYKLIVGGQTFDDFTDHPRVFGVFNPRVGQYSSAAGKFQITKSTWDRLVNKYGKEELPNFSPENQEKAAWLLAKEDYQRATNSDLEADINSDDPKVLKKVKDALAPTWESLGLGGQFWSDDQWVEALKSGVPGETVQKSSRDEEIARFISQRFPEGSEEAVQEQDTFISPEREIGAEAEEVVERAKARRPKWMDSGLFKVAGMIGGPALRPIAKGLEAAGEKFDIAPARVTGGALREAEKAGIRNVVTLPSKLVRAYQTGESKKLQAQTDTVLNKVNDINSFMAKLEEARESGKDVRLIDLTETTRNEAGFVVNEELDALDEVTKSLGLSNRMKISELSDEQFNQLKKFTEGANVKLNKMFDQFVDKTKDTEDVRVMEEAVMELSNLSSKPQERYVERNFGDKVANFVFADLPAGSVSLGHNIVASGLGAPVGVAYMFSNSAGGMAEDMIDSGVDADIAVKNALAGAIPVALLEKAGFDAATGKLITGKLGQSAASKALAGAMGEGVTEFFQTYPEEIAAIAGEVQQEGGTNQEIADRFIDRFWDITKSAVRSGAVGAVLGGGAATISGVDTDVEQVEDIDVDGEVDIIPTEETTTETVTTPTETVTEETITDVTIPEGETDVIEVDEFFQFSEGINSSEDFIAAAQEQDVDPKDLAQTMFDNDEMTQAQYELIVGEDAQIEAKEEVEVKTPEVEAKVETEVEAPVDTEIELKPKESRTFTKSTETGDLNVDQVFNTFRDIAPVTNKVDWKITELEGNTGADISYNEDGTAISRFDSRLSNPETIAAISHELIGHYGIDQAIANDPRIEDKVREIYAKYSGDEVSEKVGLLYSDSDEDTKFREWVAESFAQVVSQGINEDGTKNEAFFKNDIEENDGMFTKVYKTVKQFFHRMFSRFKNLGRLPKEEAIRDLFRRIRTIKAEDVKPLARKTFESKQEQPKKPTQDKKPVEPRKRPKMTSKQIRAAKSVDEAKRGLMDSVRANKKISESKKQELRGKIMKLKGLDPKKVEDLIAQSKGLPSVTNVEKGIDAVVKALKEYKKTSKGRLQHIKSDKELKIDALIKRTPILRGDADEKTLRAIAKITGEDISGARDIRSMSPIQLSNMAEAINQGTASIKKRNKDSLAENKSKLEKISKTMLQATSKEANRRNQFLGGAKALLGMNKTLRMRIPKLGALNYNAETDIFEVQRGKHAGKTALPGRPVPVVKEGTKNVVAYKSGDQILDKKYNSYVASGNYFVDKAAFEEINTKAANSTQVSKMQSLQKAYRALVNTGQINSITAIEELGLEGTDVEKTLYKDLSKGERTKSDLVFKAENLLRDLSKRIGVNKLLKMSSMMNPNATKKAINVKDQSGNSVKLQLSYSELAHIYNLAKNEDSRKAILDGGIAKYVYGKKSNISKRFNLTESTLEGIEKFVDSRPELKAVADTLFNYFNDNSPEGIQGKANEVAIRNTGKAIATVEQYWPRERARVDNQGNPLQIDEDNNSMDFTAKYLGDVNPSTAGTFKARVEDAGLPVVVRDVFDTFSKHNSTLSKYIGLFEAWKNADTLLRNVESKMTETGMEDYYNVFKNTVDAIGGVQPAKKTGFDRLISSFMSNYGTAVLSLNPSVMLKQLPSALYLMRYFDLPTYTKAIAQGTSKAFSKKLTKEMIENVPALRARRVIIPDSGMLEQEESARLKQIFTGKAPLKDMLMRSSVGAMDWLVMKDLYSAATIEAKNKGLKEGSQEYWNAVNEKIEEVIHKSQPDSDVIAKTSFQRESGLIKPFLMFFSQRSKLFQMLRTDIRNLKRGNAKTKAKAAKNLVLTHLAGTAMLSAIETVMAQLKGYNDREKEFLEELWDKNIFNIYRAVFANMAVTGAVLNEFISSAEGKRTFGIDHPFFKWVNDAKRSTQELFDGEPSQKTFKEHVKDAGTIHEPFTGLPTKNIVKNIELIESLIEEMED